MIRGTVHDLVQWIVESETETAKLRQRVAELEQELAKGKANVPDEHKSEPD